MSPRRDWLRSRAALVALVVVAVVVAHPTSSTPHSAHLSKSAVSAALAGSPAALASLHAQANQLLAGGPDGVPGPAESLRGYPVVVNKWASWCGPCQTEFPAFQRASVALGRRVAFVGIDGKDKNPAGRRLPAPLPGQLSRATPTPTRRSPAPSRRRTYYPQTVYFNRQGKEVYDHAGPYETAAALERDIRRYALQ